MTFAPAIAALRMARRNAWRSKGRSALIIAMVGLPVLGMTAGVVLYRSAGVSPAERALRTMGQADARLVVVSPVPIRQTADVDIWAETAGGVRPDNQTEPASITLPQLTALLPPGSRAVGYGDRSGVRIGVGDRVINADAWTLSQGDALTAGMVRQRTGRWATGPGEVVLSPRLLSRTGLRIGDQLTLTAPKATFRIVGTAVDPDDINSTMLFVQPGAFKVPGDTANLQWLIDLPAGVDVSAVIPALNKRGIQVVPRDWVLHPPPEPSGPIQAEELGTTIVVVGMAALEIMLLAGAAFAVGARRSRRELGLVAATGGTARHVRLVVLSGGVVLGVAAGVVGVPLGIVTAYLGRPHVERIGGQLIGELVIRPRDLLAIVAVGVLTAVLSAVLPARTAARDDVVAALTGRRGQVRTNRRITVLGVLAAAAGAAVAAYGARPPAKFNTVLAGSALAQLGFVATAPALVGLAGRLGRWLPLAARFAVRDAARHRNRSGPAVGAVMAALAGSVALSVYLVSDQANARNKYEPSLRPGQAWLSTGGPDDQQPAAQAAVTGELPTRVVLPIRQAAKPCAENSPASCASRIAELIPVAGKEVCEDQGGGARVCHGPSNGLLTIGDAALLRATTGRDDSTATAMLRSGGAVVFDSRLYRDGQAQIDIETYIGDSSTPTVKTVMVPAVLIPMPTAYQLPRGVISKSLADRLGVGEGALHGFLIDTTRKPTQREIDRAQGHIDRLGESMFLNVEQGYTGEVGQGLLALLGASAIVTFGASGIATGLALAESRPDMATLAAVGAAPRVRRILAMAQAGTIAGLGAGLGVLAGLVPVVAVISARDDFPLVIPWPTLGATVVVVPALAAGFAGLFTRSTLPLDRRLA